MILLVDIVLPNREQSAQPDVEQSVQPDEVEPDEAEPMNISDMSDAEDENM